MLGSLRKLFSSEPQEPWKPAAFRVVETDAGANVNYDCYCGCDAGIAVDRAQDDQAAESCCCGNLIAVGDDAHQRLHAQIDSPDAFRIDVQQIAMPWGESTDVAVAIPADAQT